VPETDPFKEILFRDFLGSHGVGLVQGMLRAAAESIAQGQEGAFLADELDETVLSVGRDVVTFKSLVGYTSVDLARARELAAETPPDGDGEADDREVAVLRPIRTGGVPRRARARSHPDQTGAGGPT
jgi:hypothetical protein